MYIHHLADVNSELIGHVTRIWQFALVLKTAIFGQDCNICAHRLIANRYLAEIRNPAIELPCNPEAERDVWHLFVVKTNQRIALQRWLANHEIETLVHNPCAPHKQQSYAEYEKTYLPIVELLQDQVLSLPIDSMMSEAQITHVIAVCNAFPFTATPFAKDQNELYA